MRISVIAKTAYHTAPARRYTGSIAWNSVSESILFKIECGVEWVKPHYGPVESIIVEGVGSLAGRVLEGAVTRDCQIPGSILVARTSDSTRGWWM